MRLTRSNIRAACRPLGVLVVMLLLLPSATAAAQEHDEEFLQRGEEVFGRQCQACHTLGGGDLVGPDLAGVMERRTREYVRRFILEPDALKAEDATAREVGEQYPSAMAPVPLSGDDLEALLAFLASDIEIEVVDVEIPAALAAAVRAVLSVTLRDAEMATLFAYLQKSLIGEEELEQLDAQQIAMRFQAYDSQQLAAIVDDLVRTGRETFLGTQRLQAGGPSCISCHNVAGEGALGGGTLARDLTTIHREFPGDGAAAIQGAGWDVMREAYRDRPITDKEALALNLYLASITPPTDDDTGAWRDLFLILGVLGGILALGLFDFIWRKRFTAVRKPLVEGARR